MTTKKKIVITVTAVLLVVSLAVIGVWAATTQTFTVSNQISFSATSVNATVEFGAKVYADSSLTGTPTTLTVTDSDSSNGGTKTDGKIMFRVGSSDSATATFQNYSYTDKNQHIVYTIYVTNDTNGNTAMGGSLNVSTSATNLSISYKYYYGSSRTDKTTATTECAATGTGVTCSTTSGLATFAGLDYSEILKIEIEVSIVDPALDVATTTLSWELSLT